jgi:hypothetical protein
VLADTAAEELFTHVSYVVVLTDAPTDAFLALGSSSVVLTDVVGNVFTDTLLVLGSLVIVSVQLTNIQVGDDEFNQQQTINNKTISQCSIHGWCP